MAHRNPYERWAQQRKNSMMVRPAVAEPQVNHAEMYQNRYDELMQQCETLAEEVRAEEKNHTAAVMNLCILEIEMKHLIQKIEEHTIKPANNLIESNSALESVDQNSHVTMPDFEHSSISVDMGETRDTSVEMFGKVDEDGELEIENMVWHKEGRLSDLLIWGEPDMNIGPRTVVLVDSTEAALRLSEFIEEERSPFLVVTWLTSSPDKIDFSPLKDKAVLGWPDIRSDEFYGIFDACAEAKNAGAIFTGFVTSQPYILEENMTAVKAIAILEEVINSREKARTKT